MTPPSAPAAELARRIEAAWADAVYPGDERLVDHHAVHLQGGARVECDECRETREALRGLRWQQAKPRGLELFDTTGRAALALLSPEGFCYYLPAILLACVLEYERADTLPGSIATSLIPPRDPKLVDWHRRRIDALTPAQRQAAADAMRYLKEAHGGDLPSSVYDLDAAIEALTA